MLDAGFAPRPDLTSPVSATFATAMGKTLRGMGADRPALVLLGDALDLSLASPPDSAAVLTGFLTALQAEAGIGPVRFVPGNHDHMLWTAARFGTGTRPGAAPQQTRFWQHATPAFAAPAALGTSALLDSLLATAGMEGTAATSYPNLGLDAGTCVPDAPLAVLHHGHFVEDTYRMMSRLLAALSGRPAPPMTVEGLEAANGSWIDFGWSMLGDAGRLGDEVSLAERLLETGGGARAFEAHLAGMVAQALRQALPLPYSASVATGIDYLASGLVDSFVGAWSQLERFSYNSCLTEASRAGLATYLAEAVRAQLVAELGHAGGGAGRGDWPGQLTFVFGHTHKPFADRLPVTGFARPVTVYNSGGWVADTSQLSTVEGAGVVFLDEALNGALLRLYAMPDGRTVAPPQAITADPRPEADNPLLGRLAAGVAGAQTEWAAFTAAVGEALQGRQAMYLALADREEHRYLPPAQRAWVRRA